MTVIIKFKTEEARIAFKRFLDKVVCLSLFQAYGTDNGWGISFNPSCEEELNYLHDLGAFKWYNEE